MGELEAFAARLAGSRAIALDSESDSLHHYSEKVCLVQLASDRGEAVLLDPLAVRDLSPLGPILADPGVTKVLHGADYDVTTLKRDFGFAFAGLFDTMLAVRLLGRTEIGLQAVARAELGVELSKDSQKDDWSVRPLSPRQEAYALADVQHLLALHARLEAQLREAGRLDWVLEESAAVAALPAARRERDPEAWQSVKGARALKPRGLAVLRELHAWREERAAARDVPGLQGAEHRAPARPGREGAPHARGACARSGACPRSRAPTRATCWAPSRAASRCPTRQLPSLPKSPRRPAVTDLQMQRETALKAWRKTEAERLKVDVSVVLPQRLIDKLTEAAPQGPEELAATPGLRRWRVEAFGPSLLQALRTAS